ncbi:MAG: c-type cytochrome domain-containing protein [Verrucomicrobiales bacterium]
MSEESTHHPELAEEEKKGAGGLVLLTLFLLLCAGALGALPFLAKQEPLAGLLAAGGKYWDVGGNLHPLILHLPIGVVVGVLTIEIFGWLSFGKWRPQTKALLLFGVFSSYFANLTGYLSMDLGGRTGEAWERHMWAGIIFSGVLTLAFIVKMWASRAGSRNPGYGILLLIATGIMSFGAHIGGEEIHGDPFSPLKPVEKAVDDAKKAEIAAKAPADRLIYEEVVVPILEAKCYACHAEGQKKKGGLLLDSIESIMEGGDTDYAVVAGNLEDSYMIELMHLPKDDDGLMPPIDEPQLEAHELLLLDWWVESGAVTEKTFKDLKAPAPILEAVGKMVTPAEREAQKAAEEAEAQKAEEAAAAARAKIEASLSELKKDPDFKSALNYTSQGATTLTFTSVSLGNRFTDEHLAKLQPVAHSLADVNLSKSAITDGGLQKLAPELAQIKILNLSETGITDEGITALAGNESLEKLNLHSTKVSNSGVEKLAALPQLQKIYLWNSAATKEVEAALKKGNDKLEVDFGVSAEEIEAMAKKAAEEKAKKEAEAKAKKEAEEKAKAEAARKKAEAEKARKEAEMKKKAAEEQAKAEIEKAKKAAEEKARKAAEEKAKQEAEMKKKAEEEKAKQEAEKAQQEEAAKKEQAEEAQKPEGE